MKKGLTEIICVIDKSGSMRRLAGDVIGGFDTFIHEQKKLPGEAKLTVTLFDSTEQILYDGMSIQDVPSLDGQYHPGGMTALLDAVGKSIDCVGTRLAQAPEEERPENVIMVIMTDGQENSSQEYTREAIQKAIKRQEEVYSWEFIFLGSNIDSFNDAMSLGIQQDHYVPYSNTGAGVRRGYASISNSVTKSRTQ